MGSEQIEACVRAIQLISQGESTRFSLNQENETGQLNK